MSRDLSSLAWMVLAGMIIVVFGYAFVRGISFAYFRTKLEHYRAILKEMKERD